MAKATKKQVLGRGLSAILNNKNTTSEYDAEPLKSNIGCLLYTSPSPRDRSLSRMPSSA